MPTTEIDAIIANGLAALDFSRGVLLKLIEGFPADKLTYQPVDGANPVLWQMGHLAYADDGFAHGLGGLARVTPEAWDTIFGMGSTPAGDLSAYPDPAAVRAALDTTRANLRAWFQGMDAETLAKPLPERLAVFGPSHGALMSTLAAHESMHAGQITVVRRALGLPPALA